MKPIQFEAELVEIRSRPGHSYDVRMNVPEYGLEAIKAMLMWVHDEIGVAVVNLTDGVVTGDEQDGRERRQRAVGKRTKPKPSGA